jgi:hypothetical protein
MSKKFMPEVNDPQEKLRLLHDNCDQQETTVYNKPLSQEDLDIKRETLADNCIELNRLEDDLTGIKKNFKAQMEPLKVDNKVLLKQIKSRQEEIEGRIFHFANHEEGMMETYDADSPHWECFLVAFTSN